MTFRSNQESNAVINMLTQHILALKKATWISLELSGVPPQEKKKTLWILFMDGVQPSQGYRATTRRQFTFYHSIPKSS